MSNGPVYCPNDKTELKYGQGGFECPTCGLWWCGQFPVRDNRVDGKVLQFGQLHNRYAALTAENSKLRGVVEAAKKIREWACGWENEENALKGVVDVTITDDGHSCYLPISMLEELVNAYRAALSKGESHDDN